MSTTNLFFFIGSTCGITLYGIYFYYEMGVLSKETEKKKNLPFGGVTEYELIHRLLFISFNLFLCMLTAFICGFLFHLLVNFIPN
tara:strand:- start:1884 stop:2138 length:255 start_codon:yes stop_codon:yes gene_type:complete